MSTTYLIFPDQQTAIDVLVAAGYTMDEWNAHCDGDGWGPVMQGNSGIEVNLYDCNNLHESLQQYVVPAPLTPNNVRAGDVVDTVNLTVYVSEAIRGQAVAMVVQLAGPTHSGMWQTPVTRNGEQWYVNSGPVRVELAAMLQDASLLAAAFGMPIEQAEVMLSQCVVVQGLLQI